MFARCEELGEDHVRDIVGQWPQPLQGHAREWLKLRREERERRNEAALAEQMKVARRAKDASVWAAILAAASILVSLFLWALPRPPTPRAAATPSATAGIAEAPQKSGPAQKVGGPH